MPPRPPLPRFPPYDGRDGTPPLPSRWPFGSQRDAASHLNNDSSPLNTQEGHLGRQSPLCFPAPCAPDPCPMCSRPHVTWTPGGCNGRSHHLLPSAKTSHPGPHLLSASPGGRPWGAKHDGVWRPDPLLLLLFLLHLLLWRRLWPMKKRMAQ